MRGWVLQDSEIDALELSDELKDFAREMAGESAVSLTDDRENILLSAALEVELYVSKMMVSGRGWCAACRHVRGRGRGALHRARRRRLAAVDRRDRDRRRTVG